MSTPSFHLISHPLCPYVQRSVITLLEKSIPYRRTDIDLANKPADFSGYAPLGKVPILLVDERPALFESAVICEYLDEVTPGSIQPLDPFERAQQRAWIEFGSGILNSIAQWYNAKDKARFTSIALEIQQKFAVLEREIKDPVFFNGSEFQLVDGAYAPIFRYFDVLELFIDLAVFNELPKVQQWRNNLRQRSSVIAAVGDDYEARLLTFFAQRNSYLSSLQPQ